MLAYNSNIISNKTKLILQGNCVLTSAKSRVNKYYLFERGSGNLNLLGRKQNVNISMKYLFCKELIKSTIEVIEQKIDSCNVYVSEQYYTHTGSVELKRKNKHFRLFLFQSPNIDRTF